MMQSDLLTVAVSQISPVWLDREATLEKIKTQVTAAADQDARLVVFGEALVPGYPFWLDRTEGARFNSPLQKEYHALYLREGVQIEAGHLDELCAHAAERRIAVILGIMERPLDRGGHSLYASLVYIDASGSIESVHRKLMPTYEERLCWSPGDGNGLVTHRLGPFTLGGLNCWENWMPLARAALYGLGEDLHVAIWPGGVPITREITRFMALEGRSYVLSVGGLYSKATIPESFPGRELLLEAEGEWFANGGTCVAAPDGSWVLEPVARKECLEVLTLDHARVREERQNFDPSGHYARPDVLSLHVNRNRFKPVHVHEENLDP